MSAGSPMARGRTTADDLWEAGLLGEGDTLVEVPERVAVVEVRRVNRMVGLPQFVGEGEEANRPPLRMMKQEQRRHHGTAANVGWVGNWRTAVSAAPTRSPAKSTSCGATKSSSGSMKSMGQSVGAALASPHTTLQRHIRRAIARDDTE